MTKKISLFLLINIFIILISCTNGSTGPKGEMLKLRATIYFYGDATSPNSSKNMVVVKYSSGNKETEYTETELLNGYVEVLKDATVTITLIPDKDDDFTYIDGDVYETFDKSKREYTFKMDSDKNFEIIFSRVKIETVEFKFEAGKNGTIELSKVKNGETAIETTLVNAGKTETIKMLLSEFNDHTITVKAIAGKGYIFDNWTGENIAGSSFTVLETMKDKTIKANFVLESTTPITFKANTGGDIDVTIKKLSDGSSEVTTINAESQKTLDIGDSKFVIADYSITANAKPKAGHIFEKWSGYTIGIDPAVDNFQVVKTMGGKTIEASFTSTATSPVTFKTGKGSINVVIKNGGNIVQSATVSPDSEETIQIADTRFGTHTIEATVTANSGYNFTGWSGGGTSGVAFISKTLDNSMKNQTITASFTEKMLSFSFKANTGGSITVSVAGPSPSTHPILAGTSGTITIAENKFVAGSGYTISVKATASSGSPAYLFDGWINNSATVDSFTLTSAMANTTGSPIEAKFTEELSFSFESGTGGVLEVYKTHKTTPSDKTLVKTASGAVETYKIGASSLSTYKLQLIPKPNAGYSFSTWSGSSGVTGSANPFEITDGTHKGKTFKANFVLETQDFKFKANAGGRIVVTVKNGATVESTTTVLPSDNIKTIPIAKNRVTANTVTAEAIADTGYSFASWANVTGGNPLIITTSMAGTITANFTENVLEFSFEAKAGGKIIITSTKSGVTETIATIGGSDMPAPGYQPGVGVKKVSIPSSKLYDVNTTLTATAQATAPSTFIKWTGVNGGSMETTTASFTFKVEKLTYVMTAYFKDPSNSDPSAEIGSDAGSGFEWISEPAHLKWISSAVNSGNDLSGKKYKFKNNINFGGGDHISIGNYTGTDDKKFKGIIDGNGKSFENAVIKPSGSTVGFIGHLGNGGEVRNLTIESSVSIQANVRYIGMVVGATEFGSETTTKILNCTNKAVITDTSASSSYNYVGGILGYGHSYITIEGCANLANITGFGNVGGIAGGFDAGGNSGKGVVKMSYNTGNITLKSPRDFDVMGIPASSAGGVVGTTVSGSSPGGASIQKSYNTGNILVEGNVGYVGGITGVGYDISDSYNAGTITGGKHSGGLVGVDQHIFHYPSVLSIARSYSTTTPNTYTGGSKTYFGGIIGYVFASSTGNIQTSFFVNTTSLPSDGYSTGSEKPGDGFVRTKTTTDLANLHTSLGGAFKPANIGGVTRPVLNGVGEGKF